MERKALIKKWQDRKETYEGFLKICIEEGDQVHGQRFYIEQVILFCDEFINDLKIFNP